jgi:hypothetical protein
MSRLQAQSPKKIPTHSTSEGARSKILPNMEILHNSVCPWLIFVFTPQRTHVKATNTIPQKNPYSFHFWMNRKQNTSEYGNISQLGSPVVNFCGCCPENLFQAHKHNHRKRSILIPLLKDTKQNTSKYGNIAQLRSPVVNFCVLHSADSCQGHKHNSPKKSILIPLLKEHETKYFQIWKYCTTPFASS